MANLAELLEQIYADVRDLGVRAVYGDALLEAGDPRGELIALQLERTRSAGRVTPRERELLAAHRDAWLGPIAPALDHAWTQLENGFLYQARLHPYPLTAALVDRHEWSTVEHLDVAYALREEPSEWAIGELIARLPQLATLDAQLPQLDAIRARVRAHPLERLAVPLGSDPTALYELLEQRSFDRLNRLRLLAAPELVDQVVAAGRLAGPGVELEVLLGPEPRPIAQIVERVLPHCRAVNVLAPWGRVRSTLADGAIVMQLFEPGRPGQRLPVIGRELRSVLDALGAARVVVRLPPGISPHAAPGLAGFRVEAG